MLAVVPRWITAFLISSKDGASIGYIVWTDSDILTSSMLLILSESTVTWISTGFPLSIREDVYTPGEYVTLVLIELFCPAAFVGWLSGSLSDSIYIAAIIINAIITHNASISFLSGMTNIRVEPLIR